mmetsp:Transcript_14809/g.40628  ORF Transcript_14809/g.40628 Transcript_14809/m.40628 type:complete len:263 (-) Transcript_14809:294-1082(-)
MRSCVGVATPSLRPARAMPPESSLISDGFPMTTSRKVDGVTPGCFVPCAVNVANTASTTSSGPLSFSKCPARAAQLATSSIAARSSARVSGMPQTLSRGARQRAATGPNEHMSTAFSHSIGQVPSCGMPEVTPWHCANAPARRSARALRAAAAAASPSRGEPSAAKASPKWKKAGCAFMLTMPGSAMYASTLATPPSTLPAPKTSAACWGASTPFCVVTTQPPSPSRGLAAAAASATCHVFTARIMKSTGLAPCAIASSTLL